MNRGKECRCPVPILSLSSFLSLSLFFSLWFRGIEGELKKRRNFRVQKSPTSSAGFKLSETLSLSPRGGPPSSLWLFGDSCGGFHSLFPFARCLGCLESRGLTRGKVIVMPLERKNRNPCCVGSVGIMTDFYPDFARERKRDVESRLLHETRAYERYKYCRATISM